MTQSISTDTVVGRDAIRLVLGRAVITEAGEHDSLVHVSWRSADGQDDAVQIYVNGELADVGQDPTHPERWLVVDRTRPQRIELLAVPRDNRELWWVPQPDRLTHWSPPLRNRARVRLLRDETLPIDAQVEVRRDGEIIAAGSMWPSDTPRSGFGGLFGIGSFGRDTAAGPGLGRGELGYGPLGTDATAWSTPPIDLLPGENRFTIHALSRTGQELASPSPLPPIVGDSLPQPAADLTVGPDFTLAWKA